MALAVSDLPRLKNRASGVTDAAAECDDCDWLNEGRSNALATASIHARRTGHQVYARQEISVTYNRREGVHHRYRVT